ncbi:MAG: DUF4493 domain-containing protein [Bacteroidales bacterium]|nr:DUF4493 domain-containing protein [Bacteroidales bacterium]
MQRIRFIPALLMILLASCSKNVIETRPDGNDQMTGTVQIALSADVRSEIVMTKSEEEPVVDDFRVAIYKVADGKRLYNDSYANSKDKAIPLNAGEYRLVAQHGDSLGCGFNRPYYMADPEFTVQKGENTVSAVAKLANVKLAVSYDATISDNYTDYYAVVRHLDHEGKSVKFSKTEKRNGYIPGGNMVLEIYADVDGNGNWKYYKTQPAAYRPNDFVTFSITTNDREGDLVIKITVDSSVEDKSETIEIPAITVPQDPPTITLAGFDALGNVHEVIEGQSIDGHSATASFLARGSLAHCYLSVESDYLASKGVPAEIDFTEVDASLAGVLKAAGFVWDEEMATSRTFSFIDFSKVITSMLSTLKATSEDVTLATFRLRVVDSVGKEVSEEFKIVSGGVKVTLDIKDYNVWAAKVVDPVVTISKGVPALVKFQVSADEVVWTDIEVEPQTNGYTLNYGTIPTAPSTTYKVRAVYNDNPACMSPVLTVRTEDALQLGNRGFEDYQLVQEKFTPIASSSYTRNWYKPYASGETDPWWATNSKQSMPDGHTGWSVTWCKNFPSSGYVKDRHSGNKAAMLFCVNVGNTNTANSYVGTTYEGELWIGTADGNGNRASEGHAFASRPSKLAFYYKYGSNEGKSFFVDVWLKATDGTVIASAQVINGPAADTWTRYEIPLDYKVINKKAAKIFVRFSSSYGDGAVDTNVDFDLGEETVTAHAGCFLKLDDIELIYE